MLNWKPVGRRRRRRRRLRKRWFDIFEFSVNRASDLEFVNFCIK